MKHFVALELSSEEVWFDLEMYKMLEQRNLEQNYFDFLTSLIHVVLPLHIH